MNQQSSSICLPFGEKIVTIGPVDPEILWLKFKKITKEINASKTYYHFGKFTERAENKARLGMFTRGTDSGRTAT